MSCYHHSLAYQTYHDIVTSDSVKWSSECDQSFVVSTSLNRMHKGDRFLPVLYSMWSVSAMLGINDSSFNNQMLTYLLICTDGCFVRLLVSVVVHVPVSGRDLLLLCPVFKLLSTNRVYTRIRVHQLLGVAHCLWHNHLFMRIISTSPGAHSSCHVRVHITVMDAECMAWA